LAICKQLTDLMGGRIGVEDRAGGGSTFWVELALPKVAGFVPSVPNTPEQLAGMRILVVDDTAMNRTIFNRELASHGMIVNEAASGMAALSILRAAQRIGQPIDIVLTDQMMSEHSGEDLAGMIRAGKDWPQPKLVLASSGGVLLCDGRSTSVAFDARLTKPVRQKILVDCLLRIIGTPPDKAGALDSRGTTAPSSVKGRILIVDDNLINQQIALTLLAEAGHEVDLASDGRQAVDTWRKHRYDAILMDVQMPILDGLHATREIRALEAGKRHVPIIAMTAGAMRVDQEACLAAGMDDYVSKPFEMAAFLGTVEHWLGGDAYAARHDDSGAADEVLPVLDTDHLNAIGKMMTEGSFANVLLAYLTGEGDWFRKIEEFAGTADLVHLEQEAHELKGVLGNLGARRLEKLAESIEMASAAGDVPAAQALVEQVPTIAQETRTMIRARLTALDAMADSERMVP
jgi:CheY-like chemotaxis protein/HPt (histidine-containing phosphotransfer) domain-containing protein